LVRPLPVYQRRCRRVRLDHAQAYIPKELVDSLIKILAEMSRYSTVNGGDITKRNHEALGNTLLTFYDEKRTRELRKSGRTAPATMRRFVQCVVKSVQEARMNVQDS
jgi:hypothetical protein